MQTGIIRIRILALLAILSIPLLFCSCAKTVALPDTVDEDINAALQEERAEASSRISAREMTRKEESNWIAMIMSIHRRLDIQEEKGTLSSEELFSVKRRLNRYAQQSYDYYAKLPSHLEIDLTRLTVRIDRALIELNQIHEKQYAGIIEIPIERESSLYGFTLRWPVFEPRINCDYGPRIHPITGKPSFHDAIDLAGSTGELVLAAEHGRVVYTGRKNHAGNLVIVDHGNGFRTYYAHLNDFLTVRGMLVTKGQPLGTIGSTGRSTGPHLHFKISLNGNSVNPLELLNSP